MKKSFFIWVKRLSILFFASVIYGIGIAVFLDPKGLAAGGVSGLAIIISHFIGINTGAVIFVINVPIIILGIRKFGIKFLISTIFVIVVSSASIYSAEYLPPVEMDVISSCACGSVLVALSIGIIFRMGATTGGSDIIVKLLRLKFRHIKTGVIFLTLDISVVLLAGMVFQNIESSVYAGISVLIQSRVINLVLYGTDSAGIVYIISSNEDIIAERMMKELELGATYLDGAGAYTGTTKRVLMSVVRRKAIPLVREIVLQEDVNAFMIVSSVNEVMGEGFKRLDSDDL